MEGLSHKVLQWYLCRMEGWFAADADSISLKCWDQVIGRNRVQDVWVLLFVLSISSFPFQFFVLVDLFH